MSRKKQTRYEFKYSENGGLLFTETQTKHRFALCREALSCDKKYTTRFKDIYESRNEIEKHAVAELRTLGGLTDKYFDLQMRAWGGIYIEYGQFASPVGAFYPFVRTRFNSHQIVDEGCVWIGSISEYPLIYVHNNVAKWVCPYSKGGFVRKEPFLATPEARKILPRLMNKAIYPDLDVQLF